MAMHADQFRDPAREDDDDDDDDDETDARARSRAWARLPTKTKCLGPTLLALGTAMLGTRALFALGAIEELQDENARLRARIAELSERA